MRESTRLLALSSLLALSGCSALRAGAPERFGAPPADAIDQKFRRAQILAEEGRASDAVMELRTAALSMKPGDPRMVVYYERLGVLYLSEHDVEGAQESFQAAARLGGRGDAHAGLGLCLLENGRYFKASQVLAEALAMENLTSSLRRRAEKGLSVSLERLGQDESLDELAPPFRVSKIVFQGNRTEDALLRRRLPFREGESIDARGLASAKRAFHGMHLFKSVEVSTKAVSDGAEVLFVFRDGWYALPFPLLAVGAGSGRGGLLLEERNYFRQAESLSLAVVSGKSGRRLAAAGEAEGWAVRVSRERKDFTERLYSDGAFGAAHGLGEPIVESEPSRYGTVAGSYQKRTDDFVLLISAPLLRRWAVEGGFDRGTVGYAAAAPSAPPDAGKQGNVFAALKYGASEEREAGGLGAILGFGMAGLEERLRPLRRPRWVSGGEVRLLQARALTGSSTVYGGIQTRWQTAYAWGGHQNVSLSVAGLHGYGLPASRLWATGRQTALQGVYAREFRGQSAGGMSLAYNRRLRATRRGVWQAGVFAEDARAWFDRRGRDKMGFGATFFYKFWRFPLPLGVGYTYSIDDSEGQVSAAVGGRF